MMSDAAGKGGPDATPARPDVPYWDDPVYRHLSRLHREAQAEGADADEAQLDALMQKLIAGSIDDERYGELASEASAARKREKEERKKHPKPARARSAEKGSSINVADLKKRIFNSQVSKENMIKAIEALPPAERRATIKGLPPGLNRKLGQYLIDGRH